MKHDLISISGAPASWKLRASVEKLVQALRRGRFIPSKHAVVLSVSCVGASEMTRLNRKYRGKARPTDVLSLEQPQIPVSNVIFLGDVVLCLDIVRAQAKEQCHGVGIEAAVLTAHGLLHLLGYDHEKSPREATRQVKAEDKLLKLAGIGRSSGLIARHALDKKQHRS